MQEFIYITLITELSKLIIVLKIIMEFTLDMVAILLFVEITCMIILMMVFTITMVAIIHI